MLNRDWLDFKNYVTWFIRSGDNVNISEAIPGNQAYDLSPEFTSTFPCLSKLLLKSRVSNIEVNHDKYQLLGWTDQNGETFGWLTRYPSVDIDKPLSKEHKLLLSYFGGVTERWNGCIDSWLLNLNSALTVEESSEGFQGWEDYIKEACSLDGIIPNINGNDYIAFAFEANGNLTLYNKYDSSIIMLAHDHGFDHITPFKGYPEYTLYTINQCSNLLSWIETIAHQELNRISSM